VLTVAIHNVRELTQHMSAVIQTVPNLLAMQTGTFNTVLITGVIA
jgi:hypothetical protein